MSEQTEQPTPHELLERRREKAREEHRIPEDARRPQDRNRAGRRAETREKPKPRKPLGKDPVAFKHLGVEWQLYPKAFDDWGVLESATGLNFGSEPVRPVPGEDEIAARDERMADLWSNLWHMLGWGTLDDDAVQDEYRLLRDTINEEYGYVSSIAIVDFIKKAQDALGIEVDPQGN